MNAATYAASCAGLEQRLADEAATGVVLLGEFRAMGVTDPVREQLVAALKQLVSDIQPCLRLELDGDVRINPCATDCSTLVPMTPAAWQAINAALAAAGAA